MKDLRHLLSQELTASNAPRPLRELIGAALGGTDDPGTWAPVGGHHIRYGDPYTLWCFTANAFVVFEQAGDGRNLTTLVPLDRVTRVTESVADGQVTVVVELDADVTRFEMVSGGASAFDTSEGAPDGARASRTETQGRLTRAGVVISEPVADAGRLHGFAVTFRHHLHRR